jgi:ABC-type branched-subunit amino acid transport system ATPase component
MGGSMYLRSIKLKSVGPIEEVDLVLPFDGDYPKPLVLVGKNGIGKTTVMSFIINALGEQCPKVVYGRAEARG